MRKSKSLCTVVCIIALLLCGCGQSDFRDIDGSGILEDSEETAIATTDDNTGENTGIERMPEDESLSEEGAAYSYVSAINVGWNLGDALGSSAKECGLDLNVDLETRWGNPKVSKELIDYVASLGFNTIRIPVSWCYNCGRDAEGHLVIGPEFMSRVHEVVDYAVEHDMYIILNTMCDAWVLFRCGVEDEAEWNGIRQDAWDLWVAVAEEFREYDEHLSFESYNELDNVQTSWTYSNLAAEQMNELNQIFVDAVRSTGGNNETRVLLVPTLFHSMRSNILEAFRLPEDSAEKSLVVAIHGYEKEFDQRIEWRFEMLQAFSEAVGAPVIIDEFGDRDDYELPELRSAANANYIARAANHGIKCCIWDDGYHWKLIDRYDYEKSDLTQIQALFDGAAGQTYDTPEAEIAVFDSFDTFLFGSLNLENGGIDYVDYEHKWWATLTTVTAEGCFPAVTEGKEYLVTSMVAKGEAVNFWIYYVAFLDSDQNIISYKVGKDVSHRCLIAEIPEGACYYAVNTFDPYSNFKTDELQQFFENGDLQVTVSFY